MAPKTVLDRQYITHEFHDVIRFGEHERNNGTTILLVPLPPNGLLQELQWKIMMIIKGDQSINYSTEHSINQLVPSNSQSNQSILKPQRD